MSLLFIWKVGKCEIKNYCESFDLVPEVSLHGGEPFLHPEIGQICQKLAQIPNLIFINLITNYFDQDDITATKLLFFSQSLQINQFFLNPVLRFLLLILFEILS